MAACKPEPVATLVVEYNNATTAIILVETFSRGAGDTLMLLGSNQQWVAPTVSDLGGDIPSLFANSIRADSLVVVYNGPLRIVHLPFMENSFSSIPFQDRTDVIWRNEFRSLQNMDAYSQKEDENEVIRLRYQFEQSDLEHAINVYE